MTNKTFEKAQDLRQQIVALENSRDTIDAVLNHFKEDTTDIIRVGFHGFSREVFLGYAPDALNCYVAQLRQLSEVIGIRIAGLKNEFENL